MDPGKELIDEAKKFPIEQKNFNQYASWFIKTIDTCGLKVDRSRLYIDRTGTPIQVKTKRGNYSIGGTLYTILLPKDNETELGLVVNDKLNISVQEAIIEAEHRLYLSSYAYHIELLNDGRYPYYRYEKRTFPHEEESYAPMLHLHVAGRLPHMPAPRVDINDILQNIKYNLLNEEIEKRLYDGIWSALYQTSS